MSSYIGNWLPKSLNYLTRSLSSILLDALHSGMELNAIQAAWSEKERDWQMERDELIRQEEVLSLAMEEMEGAIGLRVKSVEDEANERVKRFQDENNERLRRAELERSAQASDIAKLEAASAEIQVSLQDQIEHMQKEIDSLRGQITSIQAERQGATERCTRLGQQLAEVKDEMEKRERELEETHGEYSRLQEMHRQLMAKESSSSAIIEKLRERSSSLERDLALLSVEFDQRGAESGVALDMTRKSWSQERGMMLHRESELQAANDALRADLKKAVVYAAKKKEKYKRKLQDLHVELESIKIRQQTAELTARRT
mmetsp:Transcript_29100/g.47023  ORF Transcript_29100/g.47023 Transcript_29100/m.47023 type:complete len:315 (+) Transcript_29100:564-1508(+)